ncbi:hypothetical protein Drorol1_Dr00020980 [Drosera rotundifolia]
MATPSPIPNLGNLNPIPPPSDPAQVFDSFLNDIINGSMVLAPDAGKAMLWINLINLNFGIKIFIGTAWMLRRRAFVDVEIKIGEVEEEEEGAAARESVGKCACALAAASKTVSCLKFAHHVQAYFLRGGDYKVPTIFKVFQVHDGKDITTRRVEAIQEGKLAFLLVASFLKEADGLEHQEAVMPTVPLPDMLLSIEDVMENDENKKKRLDPFPIDIRVCHPDILTRLTNLLPGHFYRLLIRTLHCRLSYWFKSREKLSDDPALHRCVVGYASDLIFIQASTNPHQRGDYVIRTLSLNHTMWFHRTTRADKWILHVIDSPSAYDARGICTSQMFNTKGELVASLVQEGLLRRDNTINTLARSSPTRWDDTQQPCTQHPTEIEPVASRKTTLAVLFQ